MVEKRPDTDKVIANISQVADSLSEQVAQLRQFVTVLQEEYDQPENHLPPRLHTVEKSEDQ